MALKKHSFHLHWEPRLQEPIRNPSAASFSISSREEKRSISVPSLYFFFIRYVMSPSLLFANLSNATGVLAMYLTTSSSFSRPGASQLTLPCSEKPLCVAHRSPSRIVPSKLRTQLGYEISAHFRQGSETRALDSALLILRNGLIIFPDQRAFHYSQEHFGWIQTFRERPGLMIPQLDGHAHCLLSSLEVRSFSLYPKRKRIF
jgi:hypothetical protein